MGIFRLPGQAYDWVYRSWGWWGVAFSALGLCLLLVSIMIWFDRRR
jgi:hypothetical protein